MVDRLLLAEFLRHVKEAELAFGEREIQLDAFRKEIGRSRAIIAESRTLLEKAFP